MILSQRQLEEIAASTTKDFNRFFFGDEANKPDRSALPTPIDQFAKNYPTGTSPCTYAIEPPCTERYARWWERTGLTAPPTRLSSNKAENFSEQRHHPT